MVQDSLTGQNLVSPMIKIKSAEVLRRDGLIWAHLASETIADILTAGSLTKPNVAVIITKFTKIT